jgi:riboflavin kinase/FMN adenylyltransferase
LITHTSLENLKHIKNPIVTTGTFDGVHLGHQKILKKLQKQAAEQNGESVLFTFYPHPRMVLFPDDHGLKLINTIEEKKILLEKTGLDHLILYPFTHEFSRLTALQYVRDLLVNKIGVHTIIVGYDHHFGKNREGDIESLREFGLTFGFEVDEISALDIKEINVSSTKIRNAIRNGNITKASSYLGYNYSFSGEVIKGSQKGREIGFKTANLKLQKSYKLIPDSGAFITKVKVRDKIYTGMLNIGHNPTFNLKEELTVEVHILDFDNEIYGETLTLELCAKLREEKKFNSIESLVRQLEEDKRYTEEFFR